MTVSPPMCSKLETVSQQMISNSLFWPTSPGFLFISNHLFYAPYCVCEWKCKNPPPPPLRPPNLVGSIRRTATKLYSGSKKLRSTCSGNIRPIRRTLPLGLAESGALLWMRKKYKYKWMMVSLGSSLASEGICLFLDLWEAQPCLRDPEWDSS